MEKIVESFELYGKRYRLETGELAKQATGAVLVSQGDTTVLVTAVISKEEKDYDFFPLTVDFIEKMYAVGRIPGGYLKREARPSEKGTLTARMIDRPIRPGFADGFKHEVHVVATTFVADQVNQPDVICVMGASAALMLGAAPFDGPCACVRIGRDIETGEFIVNPTFEEEQRSDLELTIAGTADYISMVEAGAHEISEEDMVKAIAFGQEAIAEFCKAQQRFLDKLAGVTEPEEKRKIIGSEFIRVFEEEAKKIGKVHCLVQGTIYPDVIESGAGDASVIKSHHNVGGLPDVIDFDEIVEPLRDLFKDEVRAAGEQLGIPHDLVWRQPFPGPGLAVRIIGEITAEKLKVLQDADAIFREEVAAAGLERSISQYFAVLTGNRSVGVMGDARTYGYTVALRAVNTDDFMTVDWTRLPYEVLEKTSSRITNEVRSINRVVYDITSKPPATVEWE